MPTKTQWMNRITLGHSAAKLLGGTDENIDRAVRCFEMEQWSDALKLAPLARGLFIPLGTLISQAAADMMRTAECETKVEVLK